MKIYYFCTFCKNKNHLASTAHTRRQLADNLGIYFQLQCNYCQSHNQLNINIIHAETSHNKTPYATIAGGGLLGVIAGPLGVAFGLAVGGIAGGIVVSKDKELVKKFNSNYL